jgi:L,D-transpeptidase-like protein
VALHLPIRLSGYAFCALFLLAACGSESDSETANAGLISLDESSEGAAAVSADDGAESPSKGTTLVVGSSEETSETHAATAEPASTAKIDDATSQKQAMAKPASANRAGNAGLMALNDWHRSLQANQNSVLDRCSGEAATALKDFAAMFGGNPKAYRAALRMKTPTVLGDEFAGYAQAYAEGGLDQVATSLSPTPEPSPAWMAWAEALAVQGVQIEKFRIGGRSLGRLIEAMLALGYSRDRVLELSPLAQTLGHQAASFMEYDNYTVEPGGSMYVVRNKFRKEGRRLNYRWIADFNDKSSYSLREGEPLKIPKQTLSLVAWRGARLSVVYAGEFPVRIYPVSMGKAGEPTPLGRFTLNICEEKPVYYPSGKASVPYGNPDNPLGERWMGFKEKPSYGLHGTNSESTIGSFESGGCIRLHNADVIELFDLLPAGAPVEIRA